MNQLGGSSSSYGASDSTTLSLVADYQKKLARGNKVSTIKMSSLSYANAAERVGFDFEKYYNDFTNEGHMYPVHGVGDIDQTAQLMGRFVKSSQGEAFKITDLDSLTLLTLSVTPLIKNSLLHSPQLA